ncbi:Alanyl-tRNA synthetase [Alteracholeplasma palmae J233]|uniref:Alanine--tRNA ligase n=2 Tax=Acholeplasma palmae TaxID=38986 RepID=U4KKT2_ALTPJ|nr:alanine--tRNA ligase [Alteracholeplasma palmae]CCV64268.1 Alanyl-tRNA synthetase [Alteracholeplasma palmae J233]
MTGQQIRETWLNFFKSKGHKIEPSASLIPVSDPTLLWINAGVAPLKKYFDGTEKTDHARITNVQKCIRTNDIDNVGRTARHHTFFEMLGNFSIGDYFKEDAIKYGFEILTSEKWFGFPLDKLYMTYYPDDTLAYETWVSCGVDPSHLIPLEGNFWEIGAGPSGPDTEIFFDRGEAYDKRGKELIEQDLENERFIEIWNIVFSQYNADPSIPRSQYKELPNKNIDTGAGLERFACVLQGTKTNFETDLFYPIILETEKLSHVKYEGQMAYKVIADHIKTLTFAISDGAVLSNEGRGYVLRRVLRRAVKYGRSIGLNEPFLYQLVDTVVEMMKDFYPNLVQTKEIVKKIVKKEEEKFFETISDGEKHLLSSIENNQLSGEAAFKLYDTYGFPIELTLEYAEENHITVDLEGFKQALEEQKMRSRNARTQNEGMKSQEEAYINFKEKSKFVGYNTLEVETKVIKVFPSGIVLEETPFYATMGGQVFDKGTINGLVVTNVTKLPNGQYLHEVEGEFNENDDVLAIVSKDTRNLVSSNHTATHLLHQAIKDTIGSHSHQQGSQVTKDLLRFDVNHFDKITEEDILAIEKIVNNHIKLKETVITKEMNINDAKKLGAQALFSEKYGDVVRVVNINGYSIELCGGTHVTNTSEIEQFAITSVESIGSGIYRFEGVTKNVEPLILNTLKNTLADINELIQKAKRLESQTYKFNEKTLPELIGSYKDILNYRNYLEELKNDVKNFEKEVSLKETQKILENASDFIPKDPKAKMVIKITKSMDMSTLKQLIDVIYDKIKADVLFVVHVDLDKATFIAKSNQNNAGTLIKLAASLTNGSGGGKPTLAQGGTKDLTNLENALLEVEKAL